MASANSLPCEKQLECSICLNVFSEPVSTPCGHNYCKTCITEYWASNTPAQCPLCKRKFRRRPKLQVNTEFRDMVECFNNMKVKEEDGTLAKPGEVNCDFCSEPKLKAQKTCLGCLASYCKSHLEQHQKVATMRNHQLIDPVSNMESRVCRKHNKMFEFFCHEDQMCVCVMCLQEDHAWHDAISLERAFNERKAHLVDVTAEIKMIESSKSRSIKEMKYSADQCKKESVKEIADITEAFVALEVALQRGLAELIELVQEKQKTVEKQAEDCVAQLEQELADLSKRRSEMEQLLQTEDHLYLLQSCQSLPTPAHLFHYTPPFTHHSDIGRQSCMGMVKKAVTEMEKTLRNEMDMLIHEVSLSDGCETDVQPDAAERPMTDVFIKEVWSPPLDKLMMIQQNDVVDVTMDPYTAHTKLLVSDDGKQLKFYKGQSYFHSFYGRRFKYLPFVLGKEGFCSGRFYYEVRVSGSTSYVLGVIKESCDREQFDFPLPENGAWIFTKYLNKYFNEEYRGNFVQPPLNLSEMPQTIGVFVDYENGEVSFYDVDTRALIYSYTGCTFTETTPALKAFLYSLAGSSVSSRPKLYPVFGVFSEFFNDTLTITPVAQASAMSTPV